MTKCSSCWSEDEAQVKVKSVSFIKWIVNSYRKTENFEVVEANADEASLKLDFGNHVIWDAICNEDHTKSVNKILKLCDWLYLPNNSLVSAIKFFGLCILITVPEVEWNCKNRLSVSPSKQLVYHFILCISRTSHKNMHWMSSHIFWFSSSIVTLNTHICQSK